jgi:pyruvate,water dikinase
LKVTVYTAGVYGWLAGWLERRMPAEAATLLPALLLGREGLQTAAQGQALWGIARQARSSPALASLVETAGDWPAFVTAAREAPGGPAFLLSVQEFLSTNGARAAEEFELAVPRWQEDPGFLLAMLRKYLATPASTDHPARMGRDAAVRQIESRLSRHESRLFRRLLASYQQYTTWRENVKYRLIQGYARLRTLFLEQGYLLAQAGILNHPDEVFLLTPREIRGLRSEQIEPNQARAWVVERLEQQRRWSEGTLPDLVSLADGEPASNLATEPISFSELHPGSQAGLELAGIGSSPGIAFGKARVLYELSQMPSFQPGEILVAPHTDPGWTPLFLSCGAVVTEIGGFLSHGATVAREFGVPCVVNVPEATRLIRTGDLVKVDGAQGKVVVLSSIAWLKPGAPEPAEAGVVQPPAN